MTRSSIVLPLMLSGLLGAGVTLVSVRALNEQPHPNPRWQALRLGDDWGILLDTASGQADIIGKESLWPLEDGMATSGFVRAEVPTSTKKNAELYPDARAGRDGFQQHVLEEHVAHLKFVNAIKDQEAAAQGAK